MKYGREVNYAERGPLLSARCPDCSVTQAICRVSSFRLLQVLLVLILPVGAGDVVAGTGTNPDGGLRRDRQSIRQA